MSADQVAGASTVRTDDSFDVVALDTWLRAHADASDWGAGPPGVQQFSGGASNLTYLLRYPRRDLILRRPPNGTKARGAHDVGREHDLQVALAPAFSFVPLMVASCADRSVLGSEFYVMDRVVGHIPRKELGIDLDRGAVRRLCTRTIDLLVDLHSVDVSAPGLDALGKGEGYVERQVKGWTDRYRRARTWTSPTMEGVMSWLAENQPAQGRTCLIHNDFRFDNVVYDEDEPTRPVGLLDWELATLGDPLMDLGGALAYWVEAGDGPVYSAFRLQPTHLPGMLTRREVLDYYLARSGMTLSRKDWVFYEVFGLFRNAVIAQQLYFRFHHGQTTDRKFRIFGLAPWVLERRCRSLIRAAT